MLAACVAVHAAIFLPIVPGEGPYGGDYSIHFPNLLAGYFHVLSNGPFSVPWFSPAQCGGVPFLADLNVGYYSVPQWLTFAAEPVTAVHLTFVAFAALGAAGFYLLARDRFGLSTPASLTAAVLFLFNGFFAYRMAQGHLTFHPFMLTPWLAWLALPPAGTGGSAWRWPRLVLGAVIGAAIFAYAFQAGMIHAIVPVALAVGVIVLVHGHLRGYAWQPWAILAAAAALSVLLSAQRLAAAIAFLDAFPRTLYPLPGFANPLDAVRIAVAALFWNAPDEAGMAALTNSQLLLTREEWEYGVGPVAALLLIGGAAVVVAGWIRRRAPRERVVRSVAFGAAVAIALSLPFVVNWYTPDWNAFLKGVPILGSSVVLVRWFALFIPLAALAAGLAFDRIIPTGWPRIAGFVVVAAATIGWNLYADKSAYEGEYDGSMIVESWQTVRSAADIPPVRGIAVTLEESGRLAFPAERNNAMAAGYSQLACYQPMFGYRMETFPALELHPGPILDRTASGNLNFSNPACYLFPDENDCQPGDQFRVDQADQAILFAQYLDFPFRRSAVQTAADWVNLVAVALAAVAVVVASAAAIRGRRRAAASRADAPAV